VFGSGMYSCIDYKVLLKSILRLHVGSAEPENEIWENGLKIIERNEPCGDNGSLV
jgi:hypothetical protein